MRKKFSKDVLDLFDKISFIVVMVLVSVTLVLISFVLYFGIPLIDELDITNWTTLVIEVGIGIIIAGAIFVYSTRHQKKMEEIVSEIKIIEENQQSILNSEKQRVERWKSNWGTVLLANVESINRMYEILEDWLNEYKQNPSAQLKSNIIESTKRNGYIVQHGIQSIQDYLPYIENQFEDPTLSLNLKSLSQHVLSMFQSLHMKHYWESIGNQIWKEPLQ